MFITKNKLLKKDKEYIVDYRPTKKDQKMLGTYLSTVDDEIE